MTGKIIVGIVAAAFSSASAATVGVVYTRIIQSPHVDTIASAVEVASVPGPVTGAVVLSATDGSFDLGKESSPEADAPPCSGLDNSQRCVVVAHASDVRLKILGYTLTLPPMWLGGDSQDSYSPSGNSHFSSLFNDFAPGVEIVVHVGRRHAHAGKDLAGLQPDDGSDGGQNGPQSVGGVRGSETGSSHDSVGGAGGGGTTEFEVVDPPQSFVTASLSNAVSGGGDSAYFDPTAFISDIPALAADLGIDGTSVAPASLLPPDLGQTGNAQIVLSTVIPPASVPSAPEAPTWVMSIAGFAALGFFRRRRIAAALQSIKG